MGLTVLALSLALSHGERGNRMTEIRPLLDSLPFVPSPRGRGLGRGQSRLDFRYPDFQKTTLQNTDKRDGQAWMPNLVP